LKESNHIYDFIIVGQGLAGTMATHFLLKHTQNILVLDSEEHTASFAAAGIINPVTGRNYVKSWMIDTLLPFAIETYDELGHLLNLKTYQKLNILRTLHSVKEQNDWDARKYDNDYDNYILEKENTSCLDGIVKSNQSYGEISHAYQIKLKETILAFRSYLLSRSQYLKMKVQEDEIVFNDDFISINGFKTRKIIFSNGYKAMENAFTSQLPFSPAKGNALIIRGDFHLLKNLRDQVFITPLEDGTHWVGSGYQSNIGSELPDTEEQEKLEKLLQEILNVPYEVVARLSGIRPAMKTRRPIIGKLPHNENAFILNGLGTKGASLAPYFANMLVDFIFSKGSIIKEVDVLEIKIKGNPNKMS
jgi:glycine oxidase